MNGKNNVLSGLLLLFLTLASCSDNKSDSASASINLSKIPSFTPAEFIRFDHAGSIYFSHLGYSSVAMNNGDILIPERDNTALVVVDTVGKLQNEINKGRGPGEVMDAYEFVQDIEGKIYVYDQGNGKIIIFNSEMGLVEELILPPFEGANISRVFPMADDTYIIEYSSYGFVYDVEKEREKILVQYNPSTEQYGEKLVLKDRPYARQFYDGKVVGAGPVHYADIQLVIYHPENKALLTFNTQTNTIAEIDASFDTLSTIPVILPKEKLRPAEVDSILSQKKSKQLKNLESLLPEYKAVADKMIFYDDEIWLKSNLRGNSQQWFVLNMIGQIVKTVHLPKESLLMHVFDEHIGLRLDDVTFALYESVN